MHDADMAMGDEKCGDRRCKEDKFDVKHGRRLRGHSRGYTESSGPSTTCLEKLSRAVGQSISGAGELSTDRIAAALELANSSA
jgi:hypothetical protein